MLTEQEITDRRTADSDIRRDSLTFVRDLTGEPDWQEPFVRMRRTFHGGESFDYETPLARTSSRDLDSAHEAFESTSRRR